MKKIKKNLKAVLSGLAFLIIALLYLRGNVPSDVDPDPQPESTVIAELPTQKETAPEETEEPPFVVFTEPALLETTAPPETRAVIPETVEEKTTEAPIDENGTYTSKEDVALYVHTYGHLPSNYIDKKEAEAAGWKTVSGNLWDVCPGKSICAYFGNYEGQLPKKKGRKWTECDIDYKGKSRNAKRLVFSNDGLIYYTDDHYETFEQLY